jgi:uncharacterized membrane protein
LSGIALLLLAGGAISHDAVSGDVRLVVYASAYLSLALSVLWREYHDLRGDERDVRIRRTAGHYTLQVLVFILLVSAHLTFISDVRFEAPILVGVMGIVGIVIYQGAKLLLRYRIAHGEPVDG